jgi:pimeloyl-ACP methyl ester carboxylesterase
MPLNHIEIALSEWGKADGQPVIALHGWLDNQASFYPLISDGQWLEAHNLRLITVDLAGHGCSDHRHQAQGYPFLDNVDDLHQLIARLGVEQPILLGHSMGGGIATIYAGTDNVQLSALILIESLGPVTQEADKCTRQLRKHLDSRYRHSEKAVQQFDTIDAIVKMRAEHNQLPGSLARLLVERNMQQVEQGFVWRSDPRLRIPSALYMTQAQVEAFVANIKVPTLIIYATDGPWENYPVLGDRVELVENKTLEPLQGGHHLHMTNPDNVRDRIIEFLVKTEG